MSTGYLHWQEGLFLQPHHLQLQQRSLYAAVFAERGFSLAFPYGVVEARLALDDLEDYRVRFDRLRLALKSGAHFCFPEHATLPSLDIRAQFRDRQTSFMILLGVPLWLDEHPNAAEAAAEGSRAKVLYRISEHEYVDENTGSNAQPLQTRLHNGRLMFEDEDFSDMEFIPLLRVVREVAGESAGFPKADSRYVAPCLLFSASRVLMELILDLSSQIAAVRDQLATHLGTTPLDLRNLQGIQFEQMSRLRCLNRSASRLPSLLITAEGRVPPFQVYLELRDLLAELASLYPARSDFEVLAYDHDDPYPCFEELARRIRGYLAGAVKPRYRKIEFSLENGVFYGDLTPEFFKDATGYYLSVETDLDPASLVRLAEDSDHFKLMPASFGVRAIRGLALKEERHPPFELPARPKLYYYRLNLDASRRIWETFVKEPKAMVHIDDEKPASFRLTLYATVPTPLA